MKKEEKIAIIRNAIEHVDICRCYFRYDPNYFYYYPNAVNDTFILAQEEYDFLLDGYAIRKISHLKKVEIKSDKCNEINHFLGIHNGIRMPDIDITSWQTIFQSLAKLNVFIIIEDEINKQFAIGKIEKIYSNKLHFSFFDADGVWDPDGLEIRYSQITSVKWATRYADAWQTFLACTSADTKQP